MYLTDIKCNEALAYKKGRKESDTVM